MPKLIGKAVRVVEHEGLAIDECVGNVSTNEDILSIAHVTVSKPTDEPWLTLHYDEWLCVRKGVMELLSEDAESGEQSTLKVNAGETAFVAKGERFRPVLSTPDTEYIAICSPAFKPERCIREEGDVSDVSAKLKELHQSDEPKSRTSGIPGEKYDDVDILYHMCQKTLWEKCVASGDAYFPPTFEKDGMFTHATAVPARLVETGNHFYTDVKGDWICLQLSRFALQKLGITTVFEEAKPVGDIDDNDHWDWVCPHIYGGIPTSVKGVVTKTFDIQREEGTGKFLSIEGLTDV
jgi:uncharacterized protein (DUF952 family)